MIRRMESINVPAMAKIVDDWIESTSWMVRDKSLSEIEEILHERRADREVYVSLGGADQKVEGYIALYPKENQITGFYCGVTSQGIGKALMDRVKEGRDYLQLWTHVLNMAAQRFYRREGFEPRETAPPEPPETVPQLRMEWVR